MNNGRGRVIQRQDEIVLPMKTSIQNIKAWMTSSAPSTAKSVVFRAAGQLLLGYPADVNEKS